jgi:YesN/AraC family two-component response regulator
MAIAAAATVPSSARTPMPLSAIIVDDEQLAREELAYLLKGVDDINVVAQGKNGLEAVNLIREHNPDIVFLDVQMPGLDGFGVIKKLLDRKVALPKIVFATAFDQYAVKAFEVNAVDYILKPFDKKRVVQSIEKARTKIEAGAGPEQKLDALVRMLESQKSQTQTAKILIKAAGSSSSPIPETSVTQPSKMASSPSPPPATPAWRAIPIAVLSKSSTKISIRLCSGAPTALF